MESETVNWYHVIEFSPLPKSEVNHYACVPDCWIVSRIEKSNEVLVTYPEEDPALTDVRVKSYQQPLREWEVYRVEVKYTTDSYEDANDYIRNPNNHFQNSCKQQVKTSSDSEYLRHWKKIRPSSEHRASSSLKISMSNIENSSSSAHDVEHYGRQCEPSGSGESSMNVTRQYMPHNPMIPVGRVRGDLCKQVGAIKVTNRVGKIRKPITPERNIEMIQPSSENPHCSKQPLSSGIRREQVISIKICELFTEMQTKLEEHGLQINCLRMRHIEHTNTFNKIVDAINEHIDLKYTIPYASIPKELTPVVPPTMMRHEEDVEEEAEEESGRDEEKEENKVKKTKHSSSGGKFKLPPEYDPKDSRWTMRYPRSAINSVELIKSSGVYVDKFNLSNIQRMSKDCKSLARMLMLEIFSDNALKVCSLTGVRPKSSSRTEVRPGLDEHARKVLLTYVENYGKKQGWCTSDKQALTISLRNKLQEIRPK